MKLRPLKILWLFSLLAALAVPAVMIVTTALRIHLSERWCMILFFIQLAGVSLLLFTTRARTHSRSWPRFH